jgi:hypothetical protein
LPRSLLHTVVRSKINPPPSASNASASALNISKRLIGLKAIERQRPLMMAGPIALTPSSAIDQQHSDAVRAD